MSEQIPTNTSNISNSSQPNSALSASQHNSANNQNTPKPFQQADKSSIPKNDDSLSNVEKEPLNNTSLEQPDFNNTLNESSLNQPTKNNEPENSSSSNNTSNSNDSNDSDDLENQKSKKNDYMKNIDSAKNFAQQTASSNSAGEEEIKNDVKNIAEAAPEAAVAVAKAYTGDEAGAVTDAVHIVSKIGKSVFRICLLVLVMILILFASLFSLISTLPSMIVEDIKAENETVQINKANDQIISFYRERTTDIINEIVSAVKDEGDISSFSNWKRIIDGKNKNYTFSIEHKGQDSILSIVNVPKNTGVRLVFKNIMLEDYELEKIDKITLINSIFYQQAFSKNEDFKNGKAVNYDLLVDKSSNEYWNKKDTKELKAWLKEHEKELVNFSITQNGTSVNKSVVYKNFICDIQVLNTFDEITNSFHFTEEQKEQLDSLKFSGDLWIASCQTVDSSLTSLSYNIYPKIDVYSNLIGSSDYDFWIKIPKDYFHLVATDQHTSSQLLANEVVSKAVAEIGYSPNVNEESKYNSWLSVTEQPSHTSFVSWIFNEVDNSVELEDKMLDTIVPKTADLNYMASFMYNNSSWHLPKTKYIPQPGDLVFLFVPNLQIEEDGSETIIPQDSVGTIFPDANIKDDFCVSSVGIVRQSSGGYVDFVYADISSSRISSSSISLKDERIVAFASPKYEEIAKDNALYLDTFLQEGEFLWPFKGSAVITATFPFYSSGKPHSGVDFACPVGTPIVAYNAGVVSRVDAIGNQTTYGKYISIDSQTSETTTIRCDYGHLSEVFVKVGQTVNAGDMIGLSGNSGNVSPKPTPANPNAGAHLHLTTKRKKGSSSPFILINPTNILKNGEQIVKGAHLSN